MITKLSWVFVVLIPELGESNICISYSALKMSITSFYLVFGLMILSTVKVYDLSKSEIFSLNPSILAVIGEMTNASSFLLSEDCYGHALISLTSISVPLLRTYLRS